MLAQIKSCCRICHPFIHATGTRKDDYIHKYKEILIFQKTKVLKILKKISFYFSEYRTNEIENIQKNYQKIYTYIIQQMHLGLNQNTAMLIKS